MDKTEENIREAFIGESQARSKYELFSMKAEEEGRHQIAKLFRATALAEKIHARNHFNAMGGLGSTVDNLEDAIQGENYEYTQMYPKFIKDAKEDKAVRSLRSLEMASNVEEVHEGLYENALEVAEKGGDLEEESIYVCQVCGNTEMGDAPDECPICGAPREKFDEVK